MSLEHILLGLLREPASGYDLKTIFERSVGFFWSAELSQIYPTLRRLEEEGLLSSETKPSSRGPRRKVYSITDAGRDALKAWVTQGPRMSDERYGFVAQLFFLDAAEDLEASLDFAEKLRETFAARLATYERIQREWLSPGSDYPDVKGDAGFHEFMALRGGTYHMKARLAWCDELIGCFRERIAERMKESNDTTGSRSDQEVNDEAT